MEGKRIKIIKAVVCVLFWLAVWEILALIVSQSVVLPTPLATVRRLFELLGSGAFYLACLNSVLRVFLGFAIGVAAGTLLSVLAQAGGEFIISPAMSVIKSTPVASIIIVMLFFLGREQVPVIAILLIVTPILYTNVLRGIRAVPRESAEVAQVYGLTRAQKMKYCTIPSVMPFFSAGIKMSVGLAFKAGIAAEVLCTPKSSMGTMLWNAKTYLEGEDLFAWTLTVIVFSIIFEKLLAVALEKMTGGRKHVRT